LIDYLDIKDDLLKQTIIDIVKEMGKVAAPALIKALEKNNLENSLTSSILYMLGDMEDEQSQDTFIYYLNADNPKIRSMAMRGLSKLAPAPLLVDILPYAKDENPSVRKYLAIALKEYEESEAIKVLTNFLADDDFNVRFAAFESLKGNGAKAKKYLLNLIKHQDRYPQHTIDLARDLLEECGVRN
jgi:HEAT repeat protein